MASHDASIDAVLAFVAASGHDMHVDNMPDRRIEGALSFLSPFQRQNIYRCLPCVGDTPYTSQDVAGLTPLQVIRKWARENHARATWCELGRAAWNAMKFSDTPGVCGSCGIPE